VGASAINGLLKGTGAGARKWVLGVSPFDF
jgi:hypothetical protein